MPDPEQDRLTPMLESVEVAPRSIDRFRQVLDEDEYRGVEALAARARELLDGRAVWCVNSTARGGGVAEMLHGLLAYTRGAGVDTRWLVVHGTPPFFEITKRLHNRLHGATGDGGPLGDAERAEYERVTTAAALELAELVRPGDVVILHDPQTAGMAPHLREAGIDAVVWRSHIGIDDPNAAVREAWAFLRPYVDASAATVFSREQFVWDGLDGGRVVIVPPSIDVFSPKNQLLARDAVRGILAAAGLVGGGDPRHGVFIRSDGTTGRVDRRATIVEDAPMTLDDRLVVQVSRWDRLKDPVGVLRGFAEHAAPATDAHLMLVGPASERVADDPEGPAVLAEVTEAWSALDPGVRRRVHLVSLPMEDAEENAAMVNAIQSHADVVVQKSLAEGFGLTAAEAMWKTRPVIACRVGGLQDQVIDEVTGLVVEPTDLRAFGEAVCRLLTDEDLAQRLATAAHERVREHFLEPRHLGQWVDIVERMAAVG